MDTYASLKSYATATAWHLPLINVFHGWHLLGHKGQGAPKLCVSDTGISRYDGLFYKKVLDSTLEEWTLPPNYNYCYPDGWRNHGSIVLSSSSAVDDYNSPAPGVCPDGPLVAMGDEGNGIQGGLLPDIADAFLYWYGRGARVFNLSYGEIPLWYRNPATNEITPGRFGSTTDAQVVFQNLKDLGCIFVCAAGNNSSVSAETTYPGIWSSQLAVGGSIKTREKAVRSWGTNVRIVAPSENLPTYYGLQSGTSYSAPFVAGAAQLVWSANPAMSNTQVLECLTSSTLPLDASYSEGDTAPDAGFLDVAGAVAKGLLTISENANKVYPYFNVGSVVGTVTQNYHDGFRYRIPLGSAHYVYVRAMSNAIITQIDVYKDGILWNSGAPDRQINLWLGSNFRSLKLVAYDSAGNSGEFETDSWLRAATESAPQPPTCDAAADFYSSEKKIELSSDAYEILYAWNDEPYQVYTEPIKIKTGVLRYYSKTYEHTPSALQHRFFFAQQTGSPIIGSPIIGIAMLPLQLKGQGSIIFPFNTTRIIH